MPIYEYACGKCGSEFEVEQRITDDPIKTCPRCRSRRVKRLISQTSFVLKGGGWYSDLYASNRGKPDPNAKPDSGDGIASGGASDAKPEAQSEAKSAEAPKTKDGAKAKPKDKGKGKKAVA